LYVTFSEKQDWIASTVDSQSDQHYGPTQLVMTATPTLCSGDKSIHPLQLQIMATTRIFGISLAQLTRRQNERGQAVLIYRRTETMASPVIEDDRLQTTGQTTGNALQVSKNNGLAWSRMNTKSRRTNLSRRMLHETKN
jgi:hypothetical protein